jgi:5-dehydro-2-deoxygluconokinase
MDLLTMGRISVDLYPEQIGVKLEDVSTFAKSLGGSPTNVAVAAARLGASAAVVTKVGDDPFGRYCRRALREFGVDDAFVGVHPTLRTPLAFCEIHPPDDFPLLFYREPKAPDLEIRADELDLDAVRAARILWVTGTGLSQQPSREATLTALRAREGKTVILDLDYRPMFWASPREATTMAQEALRYATVAVGNREEVEIAVGTREPDEAADRLLEAGVEIAVVKQGPAGVLVASREGRASVPPVPTEVVCGLGAGDAFGGSLAYGLLQGWPPERAVRMANAAGSIVASRLACADAMPTLEELEGVLA